MKTTNLPIDPPTVGVRGRQPSTNISARHLRLEGIQLKLRDAWRQGERKLLEEFTSILDDIAVNDDEMWMLISFEITTRKHHREIVSLQEYLKRFPEHAERLKLEFYQPVVPQLPSGILPTQIISPDVQAVNVQPVPLDVQVPGYDILEVLGRGGMGVVYKARQHGLNRIVALKMIIAGKHAGNEELARFWREAEAVASLNHPNIVQVYEVNRHDGNPYFSLEYIEGGTLGTFLNQGQLSFRDSARLIERIARGVAVAHENQIVHRDLKPANILLDFSPITHASTEIRGGHHTPPMIKRSGEPDAEQPMHVTPKITDFGVAKRLNEANGLTSTGIAAGTPQYMSPEQALADSKTPLTPSTDIYSLGVILYECLCGQLPFDGVNPVDVMRQVMRDPPTNPRKFRPNIPRDLEVICLKCLEKEPHKRYQTASELADELNRWLEGRPILARPISRIEYGFRWIRRNPTVAGLLCGIMLLMMVGTTVSSVFAVRANKYADEAKVRSDEVAKSAQDLAREKQQALRTAADAIEAAEKTRLANEVIEQQLAEIKQARLGEAAAIERMYTREYGAKVASAFLEYNSGQMPDMVRMVNDLQPKPGEKDFRQFEWWYLKQLSNPTIFQWPQYTHVVGCKAVPKSKQWVVITPHEVHWLDAYSPLKKSCPLPQPFIDHVSIHVESKRFAYDSSRKRSIGIADLETGKELLAVKLDDLTKDGTLWFGLKVSISPDGETLAACMFNINRFDDSLVVILSMKTGEVLAKQRLKEQQMHSVVHSGKPGKLVGCGASGRWWVWDDHKLEQLHTGVQNGPITGIVTNQDASVIALCGYQGKINVIDTERGTLNKVLSSYVNLQAPMVISSTGQYLATGGSDHSVRVFNLITGEEIQKLPGHHYRVTSIAFSDTDSHVLSTGVFDGVSLCERMDDPKGRHYRFPNQGHPIGFYPMPDQVRWIGVDDTGGMQYFDRMGEVVGPYHRLFPEPTRTEFWQLSPNGTNAVFKTPNFFGPDEDGETNRGSQSVLWYLKISDNAYDKFRLPAVMGDAHKVAFSADSNLIATTNRTGIVRIYDVTRKQIISTFIGGGNDQTYVHFAPDGQSLFLGVGQQMRIRRVALDGETIWENQYPLSVLQRIHREYGGAMSATALSPDGSIFAVAGLDNEISLFDGKTGQLKEIASPNKGAASKLVIQGHAQPVMSLVFSPTGERLASVSFDGMLRIWETRFGQPIIWLNGKMSYMHHLAFSRDGASLAHTTESDTRMLDGYKSFRAHMLDRVFSDGRFETVVPTVEQNKILNLKGIFKNTSNSRLIFPQLDLNSPRIFYMVEIRPKNRNLINLPDMVKIPEDNLFMPPNVDLVRFTYLEPNQTVSLPFRLSIYNWPAGEYEVRMTHVVNHKRDKFPSPWVSFIIPQVP